MRILDATTGAMLPRNIPVKYPVVMMHNTYNIAG